MNGNGLDPDGGFSVETSGPGRREAKPQKPAGIKQPLQGICIGVQRPALLAGWLRHFAESACFL